MADPGSVSYLFARKGVMIVGKVGGVTEDDVLMAVLDAGADEEIEDLGVLRGGLRGRRTWSRSRTALQQAGIDYESAEAAFLPSVEIRFWTRSRAKRVFRLIEAIEDSDDVQDVYELLGPGRGHGEAGCRPRPGWRRAAAAAGDRRAAGDPTGLPGMTTLSR